MTTKQIKKIHTEINSLKQELKRLRVLMRGATAKDTEGEYKPSFVREIQRLKKTKPAGEIKTPKDLVDLFS